MISEPKGWVLVAFPSLFPSHKLIFRADKFFFDSYMILILPLWCFWFRCFLDEEDDVLCFHVRSEYMGAKHEMVFGSDFQVWLNHANNLWLKHIRGQILFTITCWSKFLRYLVINTTPYIEILGPSMQMAVESSSPLDINLKNLHYLGPTK